MKQRQKPFYQVQAAKFAAWLENQQEPWWSVDGDVILTERVDFPCPGDELAKAIREIDKPIIFFVPDSTSKARGEEIPVERLDELADDDNPDKAKTFLCSWSESDIEWLLAEERAPDSSCT